MNNTPFKKRSDPFATPTPKVEPVVEQHEIPQQRVETVVEKVVEPVYVQKVEQKQVRTKIVTKVEDDGNREKYTATMEKTLRRRIKVASAMDGIQVSTFIEQACLEKLEREGR